MIRRPKIQVGNVYQIHLLNGKWAYAQYLKHNDQLGYLIRVLDSVREEPVADANELKLAGDLFPPIFLGLLSTVRSGRWKMIGNLPVAKFSFPHFRNTIGTKPGTYHDWRIWDGINSVRVGDLPVELRTLELEQVWGDEGLEERIVAGTYRGDRMF